VDVNEFYGKGFHHKNVQVKSFDEHPEEVGANKVCQQDVRVTAGLDTNGWRQ